MKHSFYIRHGKRWLDATASLIGLILLMPVFFFIALAVILDSPGSPFFLQDRVGKLGKTFRIVKFRSMRAASENSGALITARGDSRVTRVGKWLRRTKFDELPQLWNVFLGDMSLVGPRPEVPKYTAFYNSEQRSVFELHPGITGPAAIAYANEEVLLSRQENREAYYVGVLLPAKLEMDLDYCRKASLMGDISFVMGTFRRLLGHAEASRQNVEAPSPRRVEEPS